MSDPKCPDCRGFGYTKGGPEGPWEKLDCGLCKGTGKEPIAYLEPLLLEWREYMVGPAPSVREANNPHGRLIRAIDRLFGMEPKP